MSTLSDPESALARPRVAVERGAILAEAGSVLPTVCIKCGAREHDSGFARVRHVYGAASIDFALCARCAGRWRTAMTQRKMLFLVMGLVPVWTIGLMITTGKSIPLGILVFMAVVPSAFIVFHATRLRKQFGAWGKLTADGRVALYGAHADALAFLAKR